MKLITPRYSATTLSPISCVSLELEKPGVLLLLPLDPDPSLCDNLHPADIWVPGGPSRLREAWDFLGSSIMRLAAFCHSLARCRVRICFGTLVLVPIFTLLPVLFRSLVFQASVGRKRVAPTPRSVVTWLASKVKQGSRGSPFDHSQNARAIWRRVPQVLLAGVEGMQIVD